MGKFKSEIKNLVQEMFPFLVGRIIAILPKEALPDGPGSHTEVNVKYTWETLQAHAFDSMSFQ
mgnify:CR=1 FL=1